MATTKRELLLGRNTYELSVRQEPGGYFGAWFCLACHCGSVKYDLYSSREDAFDAADAGAQEHESDKHVSN
jgi:hypothetical protein